jgi:hypothetical protein
MPAVAKSMTPSLKNSLTDNGHENYKLRDSVAGLWAGRQDHISPLSMKSYAKCVEFAFHWMNGAVFFDFRFPVSSFILPPLSVNALP